jgi:hypothetical protein
MSWRLYYDLFDINSQMTSCDVRLHFTISRLTTGAMTLGIMTLAITTLAITTLGEADLIVTLSRLFVKLFML